MCPHVRNFVMASVNFAVYCACRENRQSLLALEQYDDLL
jgi:hypothetical protein